MSPQFSTLTHPPSFHPIATSACRSFLFPNKPIYGMMIALRSWLVTIQPIRFKKRYMNEVNTPADTGITGTEAVEERVESVRKLIVEMCPYRFSYLISFDLNSSFSIGEPIFYGVFFWQETLKHQAWPTINSIL